MRLQSKRTTFYFGLRLYMRGLLLYIKFYILTIHIGTSKTSGVFRLSFVWLERFFNDRAK